MGRITHDHKTGTWHGLHLNCNAEHDAGVRYYPDGSGEPPSSEYDLTVEIDDQDEWLFHLEEEVFGRSNDTEERTLMERALPWARIGALPPGFAEDLLDVCFDDVMDTLYR